MIHWTEDLRIGHPIIDADHKRLIEIINEFLEHSKSLDNAQLMSETLKALLKYGQEHFAREQKIQQDCRYPYHAMHVREHNMLLVQIRAMGNEYFIDKGKPLDSDAIMELNRFMQHWLINHIKKFDTNMRDWVSQVST